MPFPGEFKTGRIEMKLLLHISLLGLLLIMTASCAVGPDYRRSELQRNVLQKKKAWSTASTELAPAQVIQIEWWSNFNDPYLNELINKAISGNLDLKILSERIREAGISIKQTKAREMPSANLSSGVRYSQGKWSSSDFTNDSDSDTADLTSDSESSWEADLGLDVNWEIDIWGKNRSEFLSAQASFEESKANYRAEYLTLVAEIAQFYFNIRQTDRQLVMTRKFCKDNQEKLSIYKNQYQEGLIPEWKLSRQIAEVKSSEQELLGLERNRRSLENRIATLLGKPAGEVNIPDTSSLEELKLVRVPAGLPSDLLSRRPDIIAAEYRVIKAHYEINKSKAERLPSLSLSGNSSLFGIGLSTFFSQWNFGLGPRLTLPLFDADNRKNQVAVNEIRARIAENEYRKAVMRACEEVENVLTNLEIRSKEREILENKVAQMKKVHAQTIAKFKMGLISQLEILDIERELFASEKSLLETRRFLLNDTVTLFKALGGGWSETAAS
jgi:NodT family efflux transporter outer membrane factor (OMF) lipoprotein